jgi:hypothetical protein
MQVNETINKLKSVLVRVLNDYKTTIVTVASVVGILYATGNIHFDRVGPDPLSRELSQAGKQYAKQLAEAYADSLRQCADAIASGKTVAESQDAKEAAFKAEREAKFALTVAPVLAKVVPESDPLSNPARRNALVSALQSVADGIAPRKQPPPAPPAPPVPPKPPEPPEPGPNFGGGDSDRFPKGWVDDPARREILIGTLRAKSLKEAAPGFFLGAQTDEDVFLYRAWKDVLGRYPDYPAQQIGDCTSFGSGHAIDLLQCIDIVVYKFDRKGYRETCTEAIYGFGREVAGMLGSWSDGCYGVAVAKGLTQFGAVPREFVGSYSGKRAKEWGSKGCPSEVRSEARRHILGDATLVTTLEEADAALRNGYPFIVCSNQGFTMERDSTGKCSPQGSWPHCMFCAGRRKRDGKVQYLICQSWGPNVPSGPTVDDQPDFSFWIDANVLQRMLNARDSLVFSRFAGFSPRPVPDEWKWSGFAKVSKIREKGRAPMLQAIFRQFALARNKDEYENEDVNHG